MSTVTSVVERTFAHLRSGQLSQRETSAQSGWEISLPSGKSVVRSTLQMEAHPLIALGAQAVPDLLPWVMDEHPALRYVAIFALQEITGEKPYVPYFAENDDAGYRAKAVDVWKSWYAARGGENASNVVS